MQCEICGKETAKTTKIIMDGLHLIVCEACSGHGKKENLHHAFTRPVLQRESPKILELEGGIVTGYGKAIRQARERQGLTIDKLGKKVFEKASFLHRIEAEAVKPPQQLAKKLEAALNIKIIGKEE